jgi:outer membrane lipoprotein carrier protein
VKKNLLIPFCLFLIGMTLIWVCRPASSFADSDSPEPLEAARQLSRHLSSLDSLSFTFTQRTMGQMSGRPRQASGQAFFAKIGKDALMRWNYQTPDRQVILSDGTTLTMYFANLNQMIIAPADNLQEDVTYSFFSGESNLEKNFIITVDMEKEDAPDLPANFTALRLTPRTPASQVVEIRLWLADGTQMKRIEIRDTFDTITMLNIGNIEENSLTEEGKLIDEDFFQFSPPEGTEIIRR